MRGTLGRERTALALRLKRDPSDSARWARLLLLMEWKVRERAREYLGLTSAAADIEDLMQAGGIGVERAVATFDRRRAGFGAHAGAAIWSEVQRCAADDRAICVPKQLRLAAYRGRPSADYDAASNAAAVAIQKARFDPPGRDIPAPCPPPDADPDRDRLRPLLATLPGREREVISARFGLDGREPETFRTIGLRLGVTKERVRAIEQRAIDRLREAATPPTRPGGKP